MWLFRSAQLTLGELINIAINKCIFLAAQTYFVMHASLTVGDSRVVVGYAKDIVGIKKEDRKRALLIFFRSPLYKKHFVGRMKFYFSNNGLVINIVRGLNEVGYEVDVIDSDYTTYRGKAKYDLVMLHSIYDRGTVFSNVKEDGVVICFDTGAHWQTRIQKPLDRYTYFKERKGTDLRNNFTPTVREIEQNGHDFDFLVEHADGLILIGDTMAHSYSSFEHVYNIINGVYIDTYYDVSKAEEDIEAGRNNFLFFSGGFRNLEKGLDILLDVFIQNPDKHIYICSQLSEELRPFYKLSKYPNVHMVGYLKQGSQKFYEMIKKCNYVIQPSSHEGVPGGVLDCMQYGLIPIVTPECNIDVKDCGICLRDYKVETINEVVRVITREPVSLLKKRSDSTRELIRNTYTENIFKNTMVAHMRSIIKKHHHDKS
jgi:hypothetical protein